MKRLLCRCGRPVYFNNHTCASCQRAVAFDPRDLAMRAETDPGDGSLAFCRNRASAIRCNWIAGADDADTRCLSCRSSRVIPMLSKPANRQRWRKLEEAKRRLLYDLLRLGLPVDPNRLQFVFKEDRRTNPNVHEDQVNIGHVNGVITINAAEADEVYREQMRQRMNEPYRTLLGHFRHESGHYYFDAVVGHERLAQARELFGDESTDYDAALQRYYRDGPPTDWPQHYISSYASAHPGEDWAETWAHYLHIRAVLEAAATAGLSTSGAAGHWQSDFIDLVLAVNEVLRSMGLPDAYPFVITATIAAKIAFVHAAVTAATAQPASPATN